MSQATVLSVADPRPLYSGIGIATDAVASGLAEYISLPKWIGYEKEAISSVAGANKVRAKLRTKHDYHRPKPNRTSRSS
jgi:hypothetical protein